MSMDQSSGRTRILLCDDSPVERLAAGAFFAEQRI